MEGRKPRKEGRKEGMEVRKPRNGSKEAKERRKPRKEGKKE